MLIRQTLHLLCVAVTVVSLAWSQSSYTAAVRGVITDNSGAAVPRAKVIFTEADRNFPHTAVADDAGRYALTALPPGKYALTVEATGFKKYAETNIPLTVQQQATFDVALQVGELSTTVEVQGQAPLLNTTISTLGQVIENRYMLALPNIGRNSMSVLNLTAGVVGANGSINPTNTNFVANGARNSTSDVLVDGALSTSRSRTAAPRTSNGAPQSMLSRKSRCRRTFSGPSTRSRAAPS